MKIKKSLFLSLAVSLFFLGQMSCYSSNAKMTLRTELNEINGIQNFTNFDIKLLKNNLAFEQDGHYGIQPRKIPYLNSITTDFIKHKKDGLVNLIKIATLNYWLNWAASSLFEVEDENLSEFLTEEYIKDFYWKVSDFSQIWVDQHSPSGHVDDFKFSAKFHLSYKYFLENNWNSITIDIQIFDVIFNFDSFNVEHKGFYSQMQPKNNEVIQNVYISGEHEEEFDKVLNLYTIPNTVYTEALKNIWLWGSW